VALCVAEGAVPVTVSVYVPGTALLATLSVNMELKPVSNETGLKDVLTFAGTPLTERLIVSAPPLTNAVEIELEADCPF
jgi:hypothetical protein